MAKRRTQRSKMTLRTRVTVFVLTILALLTGGHPTGQIATLPNAVDFDGIDDYITFGPATGASGLNATDFTIELWFKREGAGVATTSGTGGQTTVIPLVAKGRGEAEGSNVDMNYLLGINSTTGVLEADFEDSATGLNHPVDGTTSIPVPSTPAAGVWHHAAATYNSASGVFNIYLDGVLSGTTTVAAGAGRIPRSDSIQHASVGSALTSTGVAAGFFNGVIDEVRIWNVARTAAQISVNMNVEVTSAAGLIGRWGMNEGAGNLAFNSVSGRPNGTFTGPNGLPTRVVGGIPADAQAPSAPQNVVADAGNGRVTIAWAENRELDLTGYDVYRDGAGTPLNASPIVTPIFTDSTAINGTSYTYTVRAADTSSNASSPSSAVMAIPNAGAGAALQFNGSSQYVTFGPAAGVSGLGAQSFTLETWFKRTGLGLGTSTGTGGFEGTLAIPLITKGRGEAEASDVDMNYFFGIHAVSGVLIADFEDMATGGNHPAAGTTPIPISTTIWHHAAATFDGTNWKLYLDGELESTTPANGFMPRFDSRQHAGIATAMTSTGATAGFFNGLLDEVRIWDYARDESAIQATMHQEVISAPGLIGRWGLNEALGATVTSTARSINGTVVGSPTWTAGYPYPLYAAVPEAPQGLVAEPGNARVSLAWTANTEADLAGYNVYRATSSPVSIAGPPVNGSTPVTSTNYFDVGLTNGTEYFYVVRALDAFGNQSGPSNEASATPLAGLNQTPVVTAGPDRTIAFGETAALSGFVTDDGPFTVQWTKVSGPGAVNIVNATAVSTTATFTETGHYVLRLTADDGAKSAFDDMTVTVDAVLVGAGDIAPNCNAGGSLAAPHATATLLDAIPGTVFTLGDNAYQDGTAAEFANCYDPTWGRHKARTRPVTGNHDYNTPNATPYYDYFNGAGNPNGPAGDRSGGYYSYNLGNWHVVVLNGECTTLWDPNGCAAGSAQEQWLRNDLANSPTNNIIAMWHRPLYSSSSAASAHAYVQPLWQALYDYGVDIWLGGHWHNYERLAPMNAAGVADPAFGIRSFVVGTGGINLSAFGTTYPTSEVRNSATHGVIKFTLHDNSYDWQFIPIAGQTFTDAGSGVVHGPPSGNIAPTIEAGPDQTSLTGSASLDGTVTDDGLVSPLTTTWSKVSGPGNITFGNADAASTSAAFSAPGVYVVQLSADDGQFVRSDTLTVTVASASGNLPPTVDVGADQTITLPSLASLSATVNDDGLPGVDVDTTWSKVNELSSPGTVTFADATAAATTATFSVPGTYVLRLSASDSELSAFDDLTVTVNAAETNRAIDFGGAGTLNTHVTFGPAPGLGLSTFTIEAWFRQDGAGVTQSTGTSGVVAVPIVTKGRNETDGSNVDMNYFMGISSTGVLTADFEDTASGLNHPVAGTTPISANVWHHAAATYDGTTWRLYLDGALEATEPENATPRSDSIQHASIGSALNSTGVAGGFFDGPIDEVRIWNRALTLGEIQSNINQPLSNGTGLVARWGLNEGTGVAVGDSTASPVNGTIIGTNFSWTTGAPFNLSINQTPNPPVLIEPADEATGQPTSPTLRVNVSDPDGDPLDVTFYGRPASAAPAPDFTIVALPDTQHYVDDPARAPTFTAQTQWIVNTRSTLNTVFVSHLGDIVEHIDAQPVEWTRADASMDVLDGNGTVAPVPYGIAPGNHDMNSAGVATNYDIHFPVSRMSGYPWYGGYLGQNLFSFTDPIDRQNKNNFSLFSAGGMDFVVIHLEYDMPTYAVAWANRVLAAYPNRRAIIATHLFLNTSASRPSSVLNRTTDGMSAASVWNSLIFNNCNVFLVLNGHYPGEANRTDLNACGQPVHQLLSDYQSRTNGGDGWLRYMTFKPSENKIYVYTYSPTLGGGAGQFETDANSQFVLDYNMQGVAFTAIATNADVASGGHTSTAWPGRASDTQYQWYAAVSDGVQTVNGPTWSFTTAGAVNNPPVAVDDAASTSEDAPVTLTQADLKGNDTDLDNTNAQLSVTAVGNASNGSVVLNGNGTVTFTPTANFSGPAGFDYTISDGALGDVGHVTVTVTPVNDVPVAVDDTAAAGEDTPLTLTQADLKANDTDVDNTNAELSVTAVSNATNGSVVLNGNGTVTFTAAADFSGPAGFDYTVSDGSLVDTGRVTITVSGANDGPVAVDDTASTPEDTPRTLTQADLKANDTDIDNTNAQLSVTSVSNPTNGAVVLNGNGTVTFTPAANFSGPAGFDYTVSDGALTDIGRVTVTVTTVNDGPLAVDDNVSTAEDTPITLTQANLKGNDTDVDNTNVQLSVTAVGSAVNGTVVLDGTGTVTFNPATNFSGTAGFDYTISDGTLTDIGHVTVTVTPANDPPVAGDDSGSTPEDTAVTLSQGDLTANDSDIDGNPLAVTAVSNFTNGTAVRNANGSVTFTPAANFFGTAGYDYTVSDGTSTDIGRVTVNVTPLNDAPIAGDSTASTGQDTPVTLAESTLLANDIDVDGPALTVTAATGATNGVVALNADRSVTFTPTTSFTGSAGFDYTISDGVFTDVGHVTVTVTTGTTQNGALDFGTSNAYVTFGNPAKLHLPAFTIETWFRRDGTGVGAQTSGGTGGLTSALPLVTRGRSEADNSGVDINFFLGIDTATSVLAADFEDDGTGTNHAVLGVTQITSNVWHHAAATYDGTTWRLYLNGNLERELTVGLPPAAADNQPAALGTSLGTAGPLGFFDGALDEARIWNRALTLEEIQTNINQELTTGSGLVARWGFNDAGGPATVADTVPPPSNGTITGNGWTWIAGAPFNIAFNQPPDQPVLNAPENGATGQSTSPALTVAVDDPDSDNVTVTYYGRPKASSTAPDFTIVVLPDTQFYSSTMNGGLPAMFQAQTQWIVENRESRNIVYVAGVGDIVQNGDTNVAEWQNADAAIRLLEDPLTTGLEHGIPYGLSVGNHDQTPGGNPDGTTTFYNQFFGSARFSGRPYYGGQFGTNNDNHYQLFSAGGMNFIAIHLEYDDTQDQGVLDWVTGLLTTHSTRQAIIVSHNIINLGFDAPFNPQGQAIYNAVRSYPNVFLMLSGHVHGEGQRSDTFNGNTIRSVLSDYQGRTNGGDGWLRIYEFSPANNEIRVKTYSPWLDQFETDADSEFTIPHNMGGVPFSMIGSTNVTLSSLTTTTIPWTNRDPNTEYEWYVTVGDGSHTVTGPVWTFTTGSAEPNTPPTASDQSVTTAEDTAVAITLTASDPESTPLAFNVGTPQHGTLSGTAPNLTYTPSANYSGPDSFTFTVTDAGGLTSNTATVSITVTGVNDAPIANARTVSTAEDTAVSFAITGNDPEGTTLTFATGSPQNGTLSGVAPNLTYTPNANYFGPDSFTFTVTDGDGVTSAPATVTITVTSVNDPPTANAQSVVTLEDAAAKIALTGTDPENSALTFTIVAAPTRGTLTGSGSARVYTPAANANGPDSFTFRVSDGSLTSAVAVVSITVTPVNDAPVATPQSVSTVQSIPVNITLTGSDVDANPLTLSVQTGPTNGTLSGTVPNLTYTPTGLFVGTDSFTFIANDGVVNSAPATVSIAVNIPAAFTPLGVGAHFPTVDDGSGAGPGPRAITPPAVQAGDLVVIVAAYRGTATLTLTETGGQVWTAEANAQANGQSARVFWTQFNGTWTANPAVTNTTGTGPLTVYSFAVDMMPGTQAAIDVPFVSASHSGGTVTIPSFTVNTAGAFALAGWISGDNNTWSAPPAGWTATGGQAQWRNSAGSDSSMALAYRIMGAGGATGSIARSQTANGPDNGLYFRLAFSATQVIPATVPDAPASLQASSTIGEVGLTWSDNATNEAGFSLERCTGVGCVNFAPLATAGPNVTSHTDSTVAHGTTYVYRVRGFNVFGPSDFSNNAETTTPTPPFSFRGVGTHFPTVENADQGAGPGPRAIIPPAAQAGDLVVIVAAYRGTATLTLSETGGQEWTAEANAQASSQTTRVFWTHFNGIWTANPAVTNTTGTGSLTLYSFAVAMAPGTYPEIDVPFVSGSHSGGTVTVPSFMINTAGAFVLAGWVSSDNNTWSAPPAGWSTVGGQAQWRNSAGSDNSIALAYRSTGPAGMSGNIARNQSASGPDSGIYFRLAFRALDVPGTLPEDPTLLEATAAEFNRITLAWTDNAASETGFVIERCTNSGCTNFAPVGTVGSNVTSFNDTSVTGSTTFVYRVRAINRLGSSNYSNTAETTTPAAPPAPPTPFTLRAVGTHFPTTDNGEGLGPGPRAVTPPASMQVGDLYVIVATYSGTATLSLSQTGGQTWTAEANIQVNGLTTRVFWCRYNGAWTANPSITNTTGTQPLTLYSFAFATTAGMHPEIDVAFDSAVHNGGSVTVPGLTTNTAGALALVGWISNDNNTYSAPGAGWSTMGGQQQWRNDNGSDNTIALAYRVMPTPGATGAVTRSQTDNGTDEGLYFRIAWKQVMD
jgi:hypothetical protein